MLHAAGSFVRVVDDPQPRRLLGPGLDELARPVDRATVDDDDVEEISG